MARRQEEKGVFRGGQKEWDEKCLLTVDEVILIVCGIEFPVKRRKNIVSELCRLRNEPEKS